MVSISVREGEPTSSGVLAPQTGRRYAYYMKVTVELQTYLDQYGPDGQAVFDLALPEGATVEALVRQLGLPEGMASVIIVNGGSANFPDPLHEGDRVILIPPLAGG